MATTCLKRKRKGVHQLCFKCSKIASAASVVDSRARAAGGGVLGFVAITATTPGSWSRARPDDARGWGVGVGRAGQGVHAVASALAECGSRKRPALKTVSIAAGDLYLNCGILRALTPGHITPLRAHTPSSQHRESERERERERERESCLLPRGGGGRELFVALSGHDCKHTEVQEAQNPRQRYNAFKCCLHYISWLQLLLDESDCVCACGLVTVLGRGLVGSADDGMVGYGERGQVRMRVVAVRAHLPASPCV